MDATVPEGPDSMVVVGRLGVHGPGAFGVWCPRSRRRRGLARRGKVWDPWPESGECARRGAGGSTGRRRRGGTRRWSRPRWPRRRGSPFRLPPEPAGPDSIDVSGAWVSEVQVRSAGVASTFPAASRARTAKVWDPCPSPVRVRGEVQTVHWAAPSRRHSSVPASEELKVKVAEVEATVPDGPDPAIVVVGACVSTVHVRSAGEASTLPTASRARARNEAGPWPRPVRVRGDAQAVHWAAPSTWHSKVEPPSVALRAKVASSLATRPEGPESIVVPGGSASTVQVCSAGVASVLPAASWARTRKVWDPRPARRARAAGCRRSTAMPRRAGTRRWNRARWR